MVCKEFEEGQKRKKVINFLLLLNARFVGDGEVKRSDEIKM